MSFPARLGIALLTFASPYLLADGVVMSNSCNLTDFSPLPGGTTTALSQTGVNNCTIAPADPAHPDHGRATASTSVTLHLPVSGQPAAPVGASILANAAANAFFDIGPIHENVDAEASATIDYLFTTRGPVRPGFIQLNQSSVSSVSFVQGPDRPGEHASISVGPLSQTCSGGSDPFASCNGSLANPMTRFLPTTTLPFTLGENFLFHEDATITADAFMDIAENGSILTNFTFTLFEADGVTPVQINLATPEPSSLALWACGLLALLAFRWKRRISVAILLFASPLLLVADGIVSTNSCTFRSFLPPETITRTDAASCMIQPPEVPSGIARASTDVNVNLPAAGQPSTPVAGRIEETVAAGADLDQGNMAEAFGSIDFTFTTAGPARSGFLLLLDPGSPGRVSFIFGPDNVQMASANIGIGPLGESCHGILPGAQCSGNLATTATRFPFALGQDFQFHEDMHMQASSGSIFELQDGVGIINFPFTLLEADGVTPVQIELAVPESGSGMLSACGLLALLTLIPFLTPARVRGRTGHKSRT